MEFRDFILYFTFFLVVILVGYTVYGVIEGKDICDIDYEKIKTGLSKGTTYQQNGQLYAGRENKNGTKETDQSEEGEEDGTTGTTGTAETTIPGMIQLKDQKFDCKCVAKK